MSDNQTSFHPWNIIAPELRHHALSFVYSDTLLNYSQCSNMSNHEIQKFDTNAPLTVEVKDLKNSKMGVAVTMNYKKQVGTMERDIRSQIDVDVIEALIEIKEKEGNLEAAETARNELATLRAEYDTDQEDQELARRQLNELRVGEQKRKEYEAGMARIAARMVGVEENLLQRVDQIVNVRIRGMMDRVNIVINGVDVGARRDGDIIEIGPQGVVNRFANSEQHFLEQTRLKAKEVLKEHGIGPGEIEERRATRINKENEQGRVDIQFVAVGPNQHRRILPRASQTTDTILEGNAVDAAYEYLAKKFDSKKNGQIKELKLDVMKWPARFMESKAILKGVRRMEVAMYLTIYEEFMEHMRRNTSQKDVIIHPGYGTGYKFKLPSEIFTVFHEFDSVRTEASCQLSDDAILQNNFKFLSIPADAITDMGIHAKIRQLIEGTIDTNICIWRPRKARKARHGRAKFDKAVIFGDLPRSEEGGWYRIARNDGGIVTVDIGSECCQIFSSKDDNNNF